MSEAMSLPESLERLEISPEKAECCKQDETSRQLSTKQPTPQSSDPECLLETLSIKAACPKGNCLCNKIRDTRDKGIKRLVHKRPILRRSKLSPAVLRAPVLRIPNTSGTELSCSPPLSSTAEGVRPLTALLPEIPASSALGSMDEAATSNQDNRRMSNAPQSQSTCCAVQARMTVQQSPNGDDTSIDELASYFDLFVHIPKKMSQMAEMMYI